LNKKLEERSKFKGLEIGHVEFESYNPLVTFNKQVEKIISSGSGIEEITMAYNDKITELFLESETFVNKVKESENEIRQLKADLEKALRTIEDRDITLKIINDSYQEKIKEIFEETEATQNELDSYKKQFWNKESECFRLAEEKQHAIEDMKLEQEKLEDEIEVVKQGKESLNSIITELQGDLENSKKEFYSIKSQLFDVEKEKEKVAKELETLKEEHEKVSNIRTGLENLKIENSETIEKLNGVVKLHEEKIAGLTSDYEKIKLDLDEKVKSLQTYDDKLKEVFDVNASNENELAEYINKLHTKENEYTKLMGELASEKDNNKEIEFKYTNSINLLKEEIAKLNTDYEEMKQAFEESSHSANDKEKRIGEMKDTIDDLNKKLQQEATDHEKQLREKEDGLAKELSGYKGEVTTLIIEKENLLSEIKLSKQKFDDLYMTKNTLETQLYELNQKYDGRGTSLDELKDIITKDQMKLKDIGILNDKLANEAKQANEEVTKLKHDMASFTEEKTKFKHEIEECKGKLEMATTNINSLSEERAQLKVRLIDNLKEYEVIKLKAADFEEKHTAAIDEITRLSDDLRVKESTIKTMDEIMNKKVQTEKKRNSLELTASIEESFISKELLIDHLYTLYIQDHSVNLQNIIQHLLTNYSIFINTMFQRKIGTNSYSLVHEVLEDLFFMIYDKGVAGKKIKEHKDLWALGGGDFDSETIRQIAQEFLETNSLGFICEIVKPPKSLDDLIQIFITNYHKQINIKSFNLREYIEREIKPKVLEKINKDNKSLTDELQTLIAFSIKNIDGGKIVSGNKELYNFKDFYMDSMVDDYKRKKLLNIDYKLHTTEAVDCLTHTLKYKSKELENLYFNNNIEGTELPIMRVVMTILFHLPSIKSLSIINSVLSENHTSHISRLIEYSKTLKTLNLSNNIVDDDCIRTICEYLKLNKTIVSLNLSNNKLSQNNGFYIADMLMKNNTIDSLYLSGNQINDSGLGSLLTVITNNNHNIRVLDISNNQLTVDDYIPIADVLTRNANLFSLNISGNEIFSKTTNILGHALKSSKLNVLYMNDMKLDEQSLPLLINNLNESKITVFHADNNLIGDVVVIFGAILRTNTTLKTLSLRNCSISPFSLICLCKAFEVSNTLEEVRLEENTFDEQSLNTLSRSVFGKQIKVYLSSSEIPFRVRENLKEVNNIILI
jgi:uncharacterized coiled-coil DUF342 family protein